MDGNAKLKPMTSLEKILHPRKGICLGG